MELNLYLIIILGTDKQYNNTIFSCKLTGCSSAGDCPITACQLLAAACYCLSYSDTSLASFLYFLTSRSVPLSALHSRSSSDLPLLDPLAVIMNYALLLHNLLAISTWPPFYFIALFIIKDIHVTPLIYLFRP